MTKEINDIVCSLNGCNAFTLQEEYLASPFSRRWMMRYCSKDHWILARKHAWGQIFNYLLKLIQFIIWLSWKIIYGFGIVLIPILIFIGAVMFWSMVFDAIVDILNPQKKQAC